MLKMEEMPNFDPIIVIPEEKEFWLVQTKKPSYHSKQTMLL